MAFLRLVFGKYRWRWWVMFWGIHYVGGMLFLICLGWPSPSWWNGLACACVYATGFGAAVLVEIATQ